MSLKRRRRTLICGATITVAAGFVALPQLLDLELFRPVILSAAQKTLNRPVNYGSLAISWDGSPCFVFRDLSLGERSRAAELLRVERLQVRVALLPLLRKEIHIPEVVVEQPLVRLERDQAGKLNIESRVKEKLSGFSVRVDSVRVVKGTVHFTDFHVGKQSGLSTSVEKLDLAVSGVERGESCALKLSAVIPDAQGGAALTLSGKVTLPGRQESLSDARFQVRLSARNLDAGRYWPYYGGNLPCEPVVARVDLHEEVSGTLTDLQVKGSLTARNLRVRYPRLFPETLTPDNFRLVHDVRRSHDAIAVQSFTLDLDQLRFKGSCRLDGVASKEPRIAARVSSESFRFDQLRRYLPYRVLPAGASALLENGVTGGLYRLDEARLNGRISRILRMELGHDDRVLSVRAHVKEGGFVLGEALPALNGIDGTFRVSGRDLIAERVSGRFGASTFVLQGQLRRSPLNFPFTVAVNPAPEELALLLRLKELPPRAVDENSVLVVTGSGRPGAYCLSGSWILPEHGTGSEAALVEYAARRSAVTCPTDGALPHVEEGAGLHFAARASYRPERAIPLTFSGTAGSVRLDSLASVFPLLADYAPGGSLQATVTGSGDPVMMDGFQVAGDVTLAGVSIRPVKELKPVSNVSGTLRFPDKASLEVDRLHGAVGNSAFTVTGQGTASPAPAAEFDFSFASLHAEDFGFAAPVAVPEISTLGGRILFKEKQLAIKELSGRVGNSRFQVEGEVPDIATPDLRLRVDFPELRVEDMLPFAALEPPDLQRKVSRAVSVQAKVTSGAGTVRELPFLRLDSELSLQEDRLDIRAFDVQAFGGSVSGKGEISLAAEAGPVYRAQYRLNHVALGDLQKLAAMERRVTGWLSTEGGITARGRTVEEIRNSAAADAKVEVGEGVLHLPAREGMKGIELPFRAVRSDLGYAGNQLDIRSISIDAFGGAISGNGKADLKVLADPAFTLNSTVANVDVGALAKAVGRDDLSGLLNLQAEVTARGSAEASLRRSLAGTMRMRMEQGSINRFPFLSKVFSVLNVSQLLDYRLPDLVSQGMPYDRIDSDLNFQAGSAYAREIKLSAPSVNLSAEGSADLVTSNLDMKVGVEALQTVGKVVSMIPVAGWLLTDRDNRMLVTYFKAKGSWDEPNLSLLATDSVAKGVLPVLKKTLELPKTVLTEPGTLIPGK